MTLLSTLSDASHHSFTEQLIAVDAAPSCMPDCWQETITPVTYARALAQAMQGNTLPQEVNYVQTELLHDLVFLLAEFVKEPYLRA